MKAYKSQLTKEALAAGRSPSEAWERVLKDNEIAQNLQAFAAAGVDATYHSCDVADGPAVAQLVERIRGLAGPIAGILHGAGLIAPCRFENNRRALVEKLLKTKLDGLMHLLAATRHDPLTHVIGFGSISGRFGANGLSDYAAGNDGLAKILSWLRATRPNVQTLALHWEQWEGAGVAMIPRLAWGPRSVMNMKYMRPEEGVRRIEEELGAGAPEAEVLYTFGEFYPMFYPREQRPLGPFAPLALSSATAGKSAEKIAPPLLRDTRQTATGWTSDVPLDPLADPFLIQHRLRKKPLLPVVVGLEALTEVAAASGQMSVAGETGAAGLKVIGFHTIEMADGLYFHTDQGVVAQASATPLDPRRFAARLTCDFRNRAGGLIQKDRLYLQATAELADEHGQAELATSLATLARGLPAVPESWQAVAYPETSIMYHGAPFRCFEALNATREAGWAKLTALPLAGLVGERRTAGWLLPSCVFDAAMLACGCHLWSHADGAVSLPRQIDRLRLGRAARDGEACFVYFRNREIGEKSALYDFTIIGEDREVILDVTDIKVIWAGTGGMTCVNSPIWIHFRATRPERAAAWPSSLDAWLTSSEIALLPALRSPERQTQWLAGRFLAKQQLAMTLDIDCLTRIELHSRNDQRLGVPPEVFIDGCKLPAALSISHARSGTLVGLSLDPGVALGVDLACGLPLDAAFRARWFSPDEQAWIVAADVAYRTTLLWGLKEAVFKACCACARSAKYRWSPLAVELRPHDAGEAFEAVMRGRSLGRVAPRARVVPAGLVVVVAFDRSQTAALLSGAPSVPETPGRNAIHSFPPFLPAMVTDVVATESSVIG